MEAVAETPKTLCYQGKLITELSREELIEAVEVCYAMLDKEQIELTRRTKFLMGLNSPPTDLPVSAPKQAIILRRLRVAWKSIKKQIQDNPYLSVIYWQCVGLKEWFKHNKYLSYIYWFVSMVKDYVIHRKYSTFVVETDLGYELVIWGKPSELENNTGIFEPVELEVMTACIRACDVYVDVGANIGYYVAMAKFYGKQVIAFEPQPKNLKCLYEMLVLNGWQQTEIIPIGLSNAARVATLYGDSSAGASLIKDWAGDQNFNYQQNIPLNKLDNIISQRFEGQKLFIKIDVEGAELNVLKGALLTLGKSPRPVWFVEVANDNTFDEVVDLFRDYGFIGRRITKFNYLFE